MTAKLLMSWDIRPETETEYFEFLVHELIPGMNKLGIDEIQVWLTVYGHDGQKLTSGVTKSVEAMQKILSSEEWEDLNNRLQNLVDNFSYKVINGTKGFQI